MTIFYDIALKGIDDAITAIDRITDNTKFAELEIQLHSDIVGAVHQIADYYARINHSLLSKEIIYREVCGSMFPMRFPFRFGEPGVYWNDFVDNGSKYARGKREDYNACLIERDIKKTLCDIREIIVRTAAEGENMQTASAAVK